MNDIVNLFFAGDFCSKPSTTNINVSNELRDIIQSCEIKVVNFEVPLKPDITLPPQRYERYWQNDDVPGFLSSQLLTIMPLIGALRASRRQKQL